MITIIIVNYNSGDALKKCVESVLLGTRSDFELVLIDNASTDQSAGYMTRLDDPRINKIFHTENLGFPRAFNSGVVAAKTDIIIGLDDDTIVPPGWDLELTRYLDNETVLVGAKIIYPDNRIFCAEYSIMPLGLIGYGEQDLGQRDYQRHTDALANTALAINRQAFIEIGGYDESFFPCQYEDIDLCYRTRQNGYQIFYNGRLAIIHDNLFRSLGREETNKERFAKNHYAFKHYPFKDSHPTETVRALAYQAYEIKEYEKAFELYNQLYRDVDYPADVFYFRTLTILKKYEELKAAYGKRKRFFSTGRGNS